MKKWNLVLVLGLFAAASAFSAEKQERSLTIQGQGKASAVPDIAVITVEVSQEGTDLDPILTQVRRDMSKVIDSLKAQGIAEKDIRTESFQVHPKYENDKRFNARRAGYVVSNTVSAKIRDLKKTGKVLSSVIGSGATTVIGPNFEIDNPLAVEREALAAATRDARAKAETVAQAAGVSLGDIQTINPQSVNWPGLRFRGGGIMAMAKMADAAEPVETGEQTLTAYVSITFALK